MTAGIKASGKPDVALALCEGGANAAAMFTSNQVVAAPVIVGRRHLIASANRVTALLVNAGNANCATGQPGIDACKQSCIAVAEQFHCVFDEVFPSSTGIIGVPLPVDKLIAAVPAAKAALGHTEQHAEAFATAILTTDTKLKVARATFEVGGRTVSLFGCCKGAGMIGPQVLPHATMLVYIYSPTSPPAPSTCKPCSQRPSTRASTASRWTAICPPTTRCCCWRAARAKSPQKAKLCGRSRTRCSSVCDSLAHQIVDDGEGVTHVVTLEITGAEGDPDARDIARSIANSPLCKTAWSSADPNWGRLLAAAGKAGVRFDPADVTITIAGLPVFAEGVRDPRYDEAATHAAMQAREYTIAIDFGRRNGRARFVTCDLTHEYVSINADYST